MSSVDFQNLINNSEDINARRANEVIQQFEDFKRIAQEKTKNNAGEKPVKWKENQITEMEETKSLPPAIKYDKNWVE